jgi:hypothetical protein
MVQRGGEWYRGGLIWYRGVVYGIEIGGLQHTHTHTPSLPRLSGRKLPHRVCRHLSPAYVGFPVETVLSPEGLSNKGQEPLGYCLDLYYLSVIGGGLGRLARRGGHADAAVPVH